MTFSPLRPDGLGAVRKCVGLAPAPLGGLKPVSSPAPASYPSGWQLLASLNIGGSPRSLLKNGSDIGFLAGSFIVSRTSLPSSPRFALVISGKLLVSTADGIMQFAVDPDTLALSPLPDYASMLPSLRTVDAGYIYAPIPALNIKNSHLSEGYITASEKNLFARTAIDAFNYLSSVAADSALYWQPVIARVRALDASGAELFITEPTLLVHPQSRRFDGVVTFEAANSSALHTVSPDLAAPAWRVCLDMPRPLVDALPPGAVIQVLASPLLLSHDTSVAPRVAPRLRSDFPLATVSLYASDINLPRVLDGIESRMEVIWSSSAPQSSLIVDAVPSSAVTSANFKKTSSSAQVPSLAASRAAFPHRFSAIHGAATADAVAWVAPEIIRALPFSPAFYAASVSSGIAWHGFTSVEFADGSVSVFVAEGSGDAPVKFSPLLSYPAADAVAITFTVSAGGEVRSGRFPLVASSDGRRAFHLHPSEAPFELPDRPASFIVPAHAPLTVPCPSDILVASALAPLSPLAAVSPGAASLVAVAPALSAQSAWDFGRSRFYLFASSGIYMLNADPARLSASLALLDSRKVASPLAICPIDGALAAIADNDIITLRGSIITRLTSVNGAVSLAWNQPDHELWCFTPSSTVVLCNLCANASYTLTSTAADRTSATVAHNPLTAEIPVEYEAIVEIPADASSLTLDIPGEYKSLTISLSRYDGRRVAPAPHISLTVSGRIAAPLRIPLALLPPTFPLCSGFSGSGRPRRSICLSLHGLASPSSRLINISN